EEIYSLKTERTTLCHLFCLAKAPSVSRHRQYLFRVQVLYKALAYVFRHCTVALAFRLILRKEVIQPHLPIRLPCYVSPPIIGPTFGGWLPEGYRTDFGCYRLSWCDGRCVQGPGTYSPRHADPRSLAIPASCRRVAAYNPNWEWFYGICYTSRLRCPLFHPL